MPSATTTRPTWQRMIQRHGPGPGDRRFGLQHHWRAVPAGSDRRSSAEAHGCMILVDESHSLGTHGPEAAACAPSWT
jgi:hypothetical protein